jgi:Protein of unknown function (DUF3036).
LCALPLPVIFRGDLGTDAEYKDIAYAFYVILTVLYAAAAPFLLRLVPGVATAWLHRQGQGFLDVVGGSPQAHRCLCGRGERVLCGEPAVLYVWAQRDDAPGLVVIGMFCAGAPLVVAVFAAVLQRLFKEAIAIKTENDLTV